MEFDVVIVGAGPSGSPQRFGSVNWPKKRNRIFLSALSKKDRRLVLISLSGAVMEPRALNELSPDWKQRGAPLHTQAEEDRFLLLGKSAAWRLPTPPQMKNDGNYIVSPAIFVVGLENRQNLRVSRYIRDFLRQRFFTMTQVRLKVLPPGIWALARMKRRPQTTSEALNFTCQADDLRGGCRGSLTKTLFELI